MNARLRQVGPALRDLPDLRAVMACAPAGHRWRSGMRDRAVAGGEGEGRVICAPMPEAVPKGPRGALETRAVEALGPRLFLRDIVRDFATARFERVV